MSNSTSQNLILIEGTATYERILADIRELETDEGIRHILDFVKIYPDFAPAHNDLAVLFHGEGNMLKALAHHEKAHKLDPGNVTYRKNLADFYFVELEWAGDAVRAYLDILKDNPFDIEALNALGTISLQLGRREQARQYFSRTLQLDADNYEARQALQQLPAPQAAVSGTDLKQIPQVPSKVCRTVEPLPEAPTAQSFIQTTRHEPARSPDELYREAIELVNANNSNKAIQVLEMLVSQAPDNALAHNDLGVLCQKSGDLQKSRHHHEAAVRLQPANTVFQKNLADLLYSGFGALEEALTIYVKLFAENNYDIELLKALAHVCLEVEKLDDAQFFLEQILTIKPWDQDAAEALRAIKSAGVQ